MPRHEIAVSDHPGATCDHPGATCPTGGHTPMRLVDNEVPPSNLVEGRLLDVGNLVGGQKHVPVAFLLWHSRLQTVPDDGGTLLLRDGHKHQRSINSIADSATGTYAARRSTR